MTEFSQLSIIFRDHLRNLNKEDEPIDENLDDVVDKKPSNSSSSLNEGDRFNRLFASWSSSSFQMPLYYPNYTKEDYEVMSEEELDRLLKLYGLPTDLNDLSFKRQFAIGAFVWEKDQDSSLDDDDSKNPNLFVDDEEESFWMEFRAVLRDLIRSIFRV